MNTPSFKFYGASWCPDCGRAKQFLGEHKINYDWIDIDRDPQAAAVVTKLNHGTNVIPTLVFDDGTVLTEPTNKQLAEKLGVSMEKDTDYIDLAIVGAGPAGMAAAIYTTREDIQTTLFEKSVVGGLASITDQIDNYPGFPDGIGGIQLSDNLEKQAKRFGANFKTGAEVTSLVDEGKYKRLGTSAGTYYAKAVLITTGSDYKRLGVPGEDELIGRGVHFCATCDGPVYAGKELIVVGGGNSAMQESLFLTKFASKITLLARSDELDGSEFLVHKVKSIPKIELQFSITAQSLEKRDGHVVVKTKDKTGQLKEFSTDGVFVFVGLIPHTAWLKGTLKLDQRGFVLTDKGLQTSIPGVFAAGDVRTGATLQLASAVGEGVTAALMVRDYLNQEG